MKSTHIPMLIVTAVHFSLLSTAEQGEKTIAAQNSMQQRERTSTLEKQYTKKLDAIKQEITMLKDSIMLVDPAVHTPKLQAIEAQFKALNDEIDKKELFGRLSRHFMQKLGAVEREIFDTKKLLGIKTADEEKEGELS
jgi:hypothetical protein